MDVGSLFGALTGQKNVKIDIQLTPPPLFVPKGSSTPSPEQDGQAVQQQRALPMTHVPSWRLHKNAFWRVKHPLAVWQQQQQLQLQSQMQSSSPSSQSYPDGMVGGNNNNHTRGSREVLYAYEASQDVEGIVILRAPLSSSSNGSVKGIEHLGVTVQFIGRIEMGIGGPEGGGGGGGSNSGRPQYDFVSVAKELAPPGVLYQTETVLPFKFKNVDPELESYMGRNVAVRYMIKVRLERKFLPPIFAEHDLWMRLLGAPPRHDEAIKMEVGIEDCLHIEFEYDRRHYHLDDTIRGTIRFLLVSIKLKHMELAVIRRETSGEGVALAAALSEGGASGGANASATPSNTAALQANVDASNIYTETQTLVKYEIMDGAPVKGEVIPVKLCLKGIPADLTPTYTAVNNRFSVRYFLNLVLVDEDDRRYFKQQEIILWRKEFGQ